MLAACVMATIPGYHDRCPFASVPRFFPPHGGLGSERPGVGWDPPGRRRRRSQRQRRQRAEASTAGAERPVFGAKFRRILGGSHGREIENGKLKHLTSWERSDLQWTK